MDCDYSLMDTKLSSHLEDRLSTMIFKGLTLLSVVIITIVSFICIQVMSFHIVYVCVNSITVYITVKYVTCLKYIEIITIII